MRREQQIEVLVVGAGPVGMITALLLARNGVRVRVIDQEWRTASRTYACALHPRTLKMLDPLGVTRDALAAGRTIDTVAFYEGHKRCGEVKLSRLPVDFPFVVVLPQSTFEQILEERLRKEGTIRVDWNHQLAGLRDEGNSVIATVDQLGVSAKGYAVPEMDWAVERTEEIRADYVVGADGPKSFVAQSLALGEEKAGETEFYVVYEFQTDDDVDSELHIALDAKTKNVLWPLPQKRMRWSFQLSQEHLREFPEKERQPILIGDPESELANRRFMQKLIDARAPWFKTPIQEVLWSTDVEFQRRVATRFGQHRCWLAGDAAHQTGPAAMQSLNIGLLEAECLAEALTTILREKGSNKALETYEEVFRAEWRRLLGFEGSLKSKTKIDPWVKQHGADLLSCLPASGSDLQHLLGQLELELA
ncbi:MAG: NAD(P)/FAD-dependent oxidoreductase [Verrucomicrobiota bacterium]